MDRESEIAPLAFGAADVLANNDGIQHVASLDRGWTAP